MERHRPRVLIVDNDEHVLIALERLLEDAGWETTTASTSEDTFRLIEAGDMDLVLLDDYLSDCHCVEILEKVRRRGIQIRCLVTCHHTPREQEVERLYSLGVMAVVKKQAHHEIVEMVQDLLLWLSHNSGDKWEVESCEIANARSNKLI